MLGDDVPAVVGGVRGGGGVSGYEGPPVRGILLGVFQTDPVWAEPFDGVCSWMDWPVHAGAADIRIDLVARGRGGGDLVAIQCKFYARLASLSWPSASTFVGMLGRPEFTSGMIVSIAGAESPTVKVNLDSRAKDTTIWRVADLEESALDWKSFRIEKLAELTLRNPLKRCPHQVDAIEGVNAGFETVDRGQLIMACGTGKTLTSLRLAERQVGVGGSMLFLVASISLLSQSAKAWASNAEVPLATFAVCSDAHPGKRRSDEDMSANDLSIPASTNTQALLDGIDERATYSNMTRVFSTYQWIDVIIQVQVGLVPTAQLVEPRSSMDAR